jgi:hypothetical protein
MKIEAADRSAAAKIYTGYRNAFLQTIKGTSDERFAGPGRGCTGSARSRLHKKANVSQNVF